MNDPAASLGGDRTGVDAELSGVLRSTAPFDSLSADLVAGLCSAMTRVALALGQLICRRLGQHQLAGVLNEVFGDLDEASLRSIEAIAAAGNSHASASLRDWVAQQPELGRLLLAAPRES